MAFYSGDDTAQTGRARYQRRFGRKSWREHAYIDDYGGVIRPSSLAWQSQKDAAHETTRVINRLLGVPR